MNAPATTRAELAAHHLKLCRNERINHQDRYYVRLAYTYGLTVPQIAGYSGLTTETVQRYLVGE